MIFGPEKKVNKLPKLNIECLNRCWILREEENQTCTIEKKIMIKIKEVSFQENPACTKGDVSSNLRVGGT